MYKISPYPALGTVSLGVRNPVELYREWSFVMNQTAKQKAYERPLYAGQTSLISLGLGWRVFRLVIWAILMVAAVAVFVVAIVSELMDAIIIGAAAAFAFFFVMAMICYTGMVKFLSSIHYDPEIFGKEKKKNAKVLCENADHSRLKFIYFRIYKDRVVINDYTGLYEWIYLLKGAYHIKVRQTFGGKSFDYGTVVLESAGTGGKTIRFNGIRDPHGLKRFLEASMNGDKIGVGVMIPH